MTSCEKAAIICNKAQYKEASFIEILKLKFHLIICKKCSKFTKSNTKLTSICDKAKLHGLTESEKTAMKTELNKEI